MKITAINTINNISFAQKTNFVFPKNDEDVFVKSTPKEHISFFDITNNKRKFEISDYKTLSKKEIESRKKLATEQLIYDVEENIYAGSLVKKYLDKTYGKNKYIFACIGNSPAGIGRVLEFMGVETKYFPATNFRAFPYISNYLDNHPKAENKYLSFLHNQGISEENIKNNDKTILFVDYTHRGDTLKCFEEFIKNRAKIDNEKIKYISLNDILTESLPVKDLNDDYFRLCDYMTRFLAAATISEYAGIPHLQIEEFENIDEIFNKKNDLTTNLFNLILIDKLNKKGKLKENPLNKDSL